MTALVEKVKEYVSNLLEKELPPNTLYHNLTHTLRVYKSTKEIIENSSLTQEEEEILHLAALFHDTGYIQGAKNHEERSVEIATAFLKNENVSEEIIQEVATCIMVTKMENTPTTQLEKIIRDADASHFAKDYFFEVTELLRKEFKMNNICSFNKKDWLSENIEILKNKHRFYTDYAKKNWSPVKEQFINQLTEEKEARIQMKEQEKKTKSANPERAIQSLYRVTLRNHIKLSDIADTKANILLSINAIIISIALSTLIPKLDNPSNHHLIVPTMIFLLFTVITIGLSVLATRPNITSGKFTKEDVKNKKVNLLFFGNFYKMSLDEYEWAINEMLKDKDYIYSSMTKDLYFLGKVLDRKYKILRNTYTIFLVGIIVSLIAFALAIQFANVNAS